MADMPVALIKALGKPVVDSTLDGAYTYKVECKPDNEGGVGAAW